MQIEMIEPQTAEAPSNALTLPQRAAIALASAKVRTDLAELVKASSAIAEIKNKAGRDECHSAAMRLVRARTAIEKVFKDARADAQAFAKAVIAEERSLIDITEAEEQRLIGLRDAWDEARAAEKAEAERVERARVTAIHARIADITALALLATECRTSAKVGDLIGRAEAMLMDEATFAEFLPEAIVARDKALEQMRSIHAQKLADEQERERERAERAAEQERLAQQRAELEQREAAARAEAERLAAEQKRLDDERGALAEQQRLATFAAARHDNGAPMYDMGSIKENGDPVMLDQKGNRSIFCDVDEDGGAPASVVAQTAVAPQFDDQLAEYQAAIGGPAVTADEKAAVASVGVCCEQGEALGVQICPECAETSSAYSAAMAPVRVEPRPSDRDIVRAVADHFNVEWSRAVAWLQSMDFTDLHT